MLICIQWKTPLNDFLKLNFLINPEAKTFSITRAYNFLKQDIYRQEKFGVNAEFLAIYVLHLTAMI